MANGDHARISVTDRVFVRIERRPLARFGHVGLAQIKAAFLPEKLFPEHGGNIPSPMPGTDNLDAIRGTPIKYQVVTDRKAQHPVQDVTAIPPDVRMLGE